jgi:hypothetical protein
VLLLLRGVLLGSPRDGLGLMTRWFARLLGQQERRVAVEAG